MNQSNTQQQNASGSISASTANTRLSGPRLLLARAVWLALVLPSVALFVAGLPVYYAQLQRACIGPVECNIAGALTARGLQALLALGVSASEYATFYIMRDYLDKTHLFMFGQRMVNIGVSVSKPELTRYLFERDNDVHDVGLSPPLSLDRERLS